MRWGLQWGRWWLWQWALDGSLSLGIHIDPQRRLGDKGPYGPYVDLHLGVCVLSLGYHPARASGLAEMGQGGIMRPPDRVT